MHHQAKTEKTSSVYRIIVCDDDEAFLKKVEAVTHEVIRTAGIEAKIHSYTGMNQISEPILSSCDIALLDVDFANVDYNGLDIARRLRRFRQDAIIIFITNSIDYAPEGYEVQAFRYVLKKRIDEKLPGYLRQAIKKLNGEKKTIKIKVSGEIIDLPIDNILYLEVRQHNIFAHVIRDKRGRETKTYTFYGTLSSLSGQLEPLGFIRTHKSYLVNMRHIRRFKSDELMLSNAAVLRVGETYYSEQKKKYLQWLQMQENTCLRI